MTKVEQRDFWMYYDFSVGIVFKIDTDMKTRFFTMTVKSASIVTLWTSARVGADRIRAGGKFVTEVTLSLGTFVNIFKYREYKIILYVITFD